MIRIGFIPRCLLSSYEEGNRDTGTQREHHVTIEAELGVMQLQELPRIDGHQDKPRRDEKSLSPAGVRGSMADTLISHFYSLEP